MTKKKSEISGKVLIALTFIVFAIICCSTMLYRVNYVDMKMSAWKDNCNLMISKVDDAHTQPTLIGLEGYGEDQIAYSSSGKEINNRCYELLNHPSKFQSRYIFWGVGLDSGGAVTILGNILVSLIVLLVFIGLIMGFRKLNEDYDDEDNETYY